MSRKTSLGLLISFNAIAAVTIIAAPIALCAPKLISHTTTVQHTVSFVCTTGAKFVTPATSIEVNDKTLWKDINKPIAEIDEKEGYYSIGWYNDETNAPLLDETIVTSNLKASFRVTNLKWYVTFTHTDGVSFSGTVLPAEVKNGTKWKDVTKPTPIINEDGGYEGLGWFNGNSLLKDDDVITNDIKVEYRANIPWRTVTFSCTEGVTLKGSSSTSLRNKSKTWGDIKKPEATVETEHYEDYGWYNGLEKLKDTDVISSNINAVYVAISKAALINVTLNVDGKTHNVPFMTTYTWKEFKEYYSIEEPIKENYVTEWYYNEQEINDEFIFPVGLTEITINAKFHLDFTHDTWEVVCLHANKGLADLKAYYKLDSFIGLQRSLLIDNIEHKVRVIGQEHDTIADGDKKGQKAALTFDLVSVICNKNGYMSSMWDASTNYDYTNSILRWNLNGTGKPTTTGHEWEKPALSLLPAKLQSSIKTVAKDITINPTKTRGKQYYVSTTYSDKLFPLTFYEMGFSEKEAPGTFKLEGEPYSYWSNHAKSTDRIKKDLNGQNIFWRLSTPMVYEGTNTHCAVVSDTGGILVGLMDYAHVSRWNIAVSFAFCI